MLARADRSDRSDRSDLGPPPLALVAVLVLVGFLLVAAASSRRATQRAQAPAKADLIKEIGNRRSQVADLDQAVRQLRSQVAAEQGDASQQDAAAQAAARRQATLEQEAGATSLAGPGLVVRLSDSSQKVTDPQAANALKIHDTDIRLVVNALLASGAEAVSVNDARVAATTAIRQAGSTIVVNFRPLQPPYRITAIGADQSRFENSDVARQFRRYVTQLGLGFSVDAQPKVEVPGFVGRLSVTSAEPVVPTTAPAPDRGTR